MAEFHIQTLTSQDWDSFLRLQQIQENFRKNEKVGGRSDQGVHMLKLFVIILCTKYVLRIFKCMKQNKGPDLNSSAQK